jgi:hypothetical protein
MKPVMLEVLMLVEIYLFLELTPCSLAVFANVKHKTAG